MKRKGLILLSSILAGSLLVGGAFAAYAVTDNADPLGVNVTPGNIDEDKTDYVTLNWGEGTELKGIGLLKPNENRKVGVVSLKAVPDYTGVFSLEMKDNTAHTSVRTAYMFDYLTVYVYEGPQDLTDQGALPAGDPVATITPATENEESETEFIKLIKFNATGTDSGKEYTIFLSLDDSATPYLANVMAKDVVRLTADWGAQEGHEAKNNLVYAAKPSDWDDMAVYAWGGPKGANGEYPGVKMNYAYTSEDEEAIYSLSIPAGSTKVIFSNGLEGALNAKLVTEDIALTNYTATKCFYGVEDEQWGWRAKPKEKVVAEISATKNGDAVTLVEMTKTDANNRYEYELELAANDVVAFKEGLVTINFYNYDSVQDKVIETGSTFTAPAAGTYRFFLNSETQMFVAKIGFLFSNNKNWEDLHIYAWKGTGTDEVKNAEWPGVSLGNRIRINDQGEDQYQLNFDGYEHLIISGNGVQTVDIDVADLAGKDGIYLLDTQDGEGHYEINTYVNE